MDSKQAANVAPRLEWIEPEVIELNVSETEADMFRGFDGGSYLDCTRS